MKSPFVPRYVRFLYARIHRALQRTRPHQNTLLLILSFVVGVGSGLGAVLFERLIHFFGGQFDRLAAVLPPVTLPFGNIDVSVGQLAVLVVGGLMGGTLVATWMRSSRGHGVPDVMASVAIRGGRIPPRVAADTAVTAGITIGAGGSAGPEGPIVQIGSSIGSSIGQLLRLSTARLRVLAACGAAGGISAIFGAPLAGVMFAVEVILGDFAARTLTPIVLSSVLAAVTHQLFADWEPLFIVPLHASLHFKEVPMVLVLGVAAALVSWLFIRVLYLFEDGFRAWQFPFALKPAAGMLLLGVVALAFPEVLGDGYHVVNEALQGQLPLAVMASLVLAKLLATSFTVGSGNVGGLFAPSLVVGAMLGGTFGAIVETWILPGSEGFVTLFTLVGMGAVIAGTTHATITAILLIFELTDDYAIVLPTMLAAATAVVLASRLNRESIYTLKLVRQGIQLRRGVEVNVMGSLRVAEVMRDPRRLIPHAMHFNELRAMIEHSVDNTFPVVGPDGRLLGVLSYQDIRSVLAQGHSPEMNQLIVAEDIATPDPLVVTPRNNLNDAMRLFGERDLGMLPVVESEKSKRLVGVLYRRDVLNAYTRALMDRSAPV